MSVRMRIRAPTHSRSPAIRLHRTRRAVHRMHPKAALALRASSRYGNQNESRHHRPPSGEIRADAHASCAPRCRRVLPRNAYICLCRQTPTPALSRLPKSTHRRRRTFSTVPKHRETPPEARERRSPLDHNAARDGLSPALAARVCIRRHAQRAPDTSLATAISPHKLHKLFARYVEKAQRSVRNGQCLRKRRCTKAVDNRLFR